jgi:hypothetical protein
MRCVANALLRLALDTARARSRACEQYKGMQLCLSGLSSGTYIHRFDCEFQPVVKPLDNQQLLNNSLAFLVQVRFVAVLCQETTAPRALPAAQLQAPLLLLVLL